MALAGHLGEARVWLILEAIIDEQPAYLQKTQDREIGSALINIREPRYV